MSRQTERLVSEIRNQRARVFHDLGDLWSLRELERRVRRHPSTWLVGGAFVGLLSSRFFLPPLVKRGRRKMGGLLLARMRNALMAMTVAALARSDSNRAGNGSGATPPGPEKGHPGSLEEPTGQEGAVAKELADPAQIR